MDLSSSRARVGIVVPLRAFAIGKLRLAASVDAEARAAMTRTWAGIVLDAAGGCPVVVVSSDADVREWSVGRGAEVLPDAGSLDAAARLGIDHHASRGCARVVVAHADLPLARSFAPVAGDASRPIVAIVPCHRDDGTPVISVPVDAPFRFSYGEGSFRRHCAEARRLGLGVRVVRDPSLALDVDVPSDLLLLDRAAEVGRGRPAA
jgi:2-phospho-L-lactate guanylyltransferase